MPPPQESGEHEPQRATGELRTRHGSGGVSHERIRFECDLVLALHLHLYLASHLASNSRYYTKPTRSLHVHLEILQFRSSTPSAVPIECVDVVPRSLTRSYVVHRVIQFQPKV